jgi:hypothetical protein
MMRVYLEYQGDSIELPLGETVIGRDIGCAVRFNDPSVSRRHVRFIREQSGVFVEDLGSANGTTVNGVAIRRHALADGDAVSVGTRGLVVRIASTPPLEPSTLDLEIIPRSYASPEYPDSGSSYRTLQIPTVPPPYDGADRRGAERNYRELRIVYSSSELEIDALTRDLSASGVFVCTAVLDPVGTECTLTLLGEGGPALRLGGIVRRVVEHGETGLGVEFVNVGAFEAAELERLQKRS